MLFSVGREAFTCEVFTATAKDLENLPLEDIENWRFGLSSSDLKGPADTVADLQAVK